MVVKIHDYGSNVIRTKETDKENIKRARRFLKQFNRKSSPHQGAWLKLPNGKYTRITHVWNNGHAQTIDNEGGGDGGSFYLGESGRFTYSGSLDYGFPLKKIKPTKRKKRGLFWIWSEGRVGAYMGVRMSGLIKVWEVK